MYKNEDVVNADSKNQERNDFNDDEGGGNSQVAEETDTWHNGHQHDQHSTQTERKLGIYLKCPQNHHKFTSWLQQNEKQYC